MKKLWSWIKNNRRPLGMMTVTISALVVPTAFAWIVGGIFFAFATFSSLAALGFLIWALVRVFLPLGEREIDHMIQG